MIRVKSIKFVNDNLFGDLGLDFALPNGKIANNIVFAGENGSGKTKLLEFIHTALESNYMRPGKDANLDTLTRIVLDIADKKLVSTDEGKTIDEAHLLCEDVGNHNINSIVYYSDGVRVSRPKGQSSFNWHETGINRALYKKEGVERRKKFPYPASFLAEESKEKGDSLGCLIEERHINRQLY